MVEYQETIQAIKWVDLIIKLQGNDNKVCLDSRTVTSRINPERQLLGKSVSLESLERTRGH